MLVVILVCYRAFLDMLSGVVWCHGHLVTESQAHGKLTVRRDVKEQARPTAEKAASSAKEGTDKAAGHAKGATDSAAQRAKEGTDSAAEAADKTGDELAEGDSKEEHEPQTDEGSKDSESTLSWAVHKLTGGIL